MKTTIGKYDPKTRTVPVTFVHNGVTHKRTVNACFDHDGNYDEKAMKVRVGDLASGVSHKIALGVITAAQPEPELPVKTG